MQIVFSDYRKEIIRKPARLFLNKYRCRSPDQSTAPELILGRKDSKTTGTTIDVVKDEITNGKILDRSFDSDGNFFKTFSNESKQTINDNLQRTDKEEHFNSTDRNSKEKQMAEVNNTLYEELIYHAPEEVNHMEACPDLNMESCPEDLPEQRVSVVAKADMKTDSTDRISYENLMAEDNNTLYKEHICYALEKVNHMEACPDLNMESCPEDLPEQRVSVVAKADMTPDSTDRISNENLMAEDNNTLYQEDIYYAPEEVNHMEACPDLNMESCPEDLPKQRVSVVAKADNTPYDIKRRLYYQKSRSGAVPYKYDPLEKRVSVVANANSTAFDIPRRLHYQKSRSEMPYKYDDYYYRYYTPQTGDYRQELEEQSTATYQNLEDQNLDAQSINWQTITKTVVSEVSRKHRVKVLNYLHVKHSSHSPMLLKL